MKTCEECEYHVEAGPEDVAFFYHICTNKLVRGVGKSRIICEKGEKPHIPVWCPKEEEENENL